MVFCQLLNKDIKCHHLLTETHLHEPETKVLSTQQYRLMTATGFFKFLPSSATFKPKFVAQIAPLWVKAEAGVMFLETRVGTLIWKIMIFIGGEINDQEAGTGSHQCIYS